MPSDDAATLASDDPAMDSARSLGPVRIVDAGIGVQLLGLAVAFVGLQILVFGVETFDPGSPAAGVVHLALGTFAVANGLYLGGVRPR